MRSIARILVTNSGRINQKRIINTFGSYLLTRNASSTQQQQIEKTVEELAKENGNLQQKVEQLTKENEQQKQDFEGRIAQLQQEKEEILKEFGKTQKLPMHEMKVQLPLEEWYDFASQIGGRQYAGNRQSFTLGEMEIIPPRYDVPSDRPMVRGCHDECTGTAVDLPDSPMPENVKNFDGIILTYVDMDLLDFLRKFQQNNLLANVQLDLSYGDKNHVLPMLDKILPLISSIYSLNIHELFDWIYDNDDKEHEPLLKTVVEQTKILGIRWYTYNSKSKCTWEDKFDWCCSWLCTPRDDGKPRALIAEYRFGDPTACSSFIDRIKKDFLEANNAVSFFIHLILPENFHPEIFLENNKTNEKLVVKAESDGSLLISRHSSKVAKNKIEEEEKEISEWRNYNGSRRICLTHDWSGY